jgi:MinD superfamily P-loop ATPase
MIRCDECKEWYHGDCVRITQEEAKAMGDFVCSGCHRHPRAILDAMTNPKITLGLTRGG